MSDSFYIEDPRPLPSLTWHFSALAINVIAFIWNLVVIFFSPSILALNIVFVIANGGFAFYYLRWGIPKRIERREQIRQDNFRSWLRREIPVLEPQLDWNEIERAYDKLIESDKEPTYERAVTWLRHEEEYIRYLERVKEIAACPHTDTEVVYIDQSGSTKTICSGCGLLISENRNPFKNPHTRDFLNERP